VGHGWRAAGGGASSSAPENPRRQSRVTRRTPFARVEVCLRPGACLGLALMASEAGGSPHRGLKCRGKQIVREPRIRGSRHCVRA
jgi:hypothetical protein